MADERPQSRRAPYSTTPNHLDDPPSPHLLQLQRGPAHHQQLLAKPEPQSHPSSPNARLIVPPRFLASDLALATSGYWRSSRSRFHLLFH